MDHSVCLFHFWPPSKLCMWILLQVAEWSPGSVVKGSHTSSTATASPSSAFLLLTFLLLLTSNVTPTEMITTKRIPHPNTHLKIWCVLGVLFVVKGFDRHGKHVWSNEKDSHGLSGHISSLTFGWNLDLNTIVIDHLSARLSTVNSEKYLELSNYSGAGELVKMATLLYALAPVWHLAAR